MQPIDFGWSPKRAPTRSRRQRGLAAVRDRPADDLFNPLVRDAVSFFTVQRDGADVDRGVLGRKPSHLADRWATVYDTPQFTGDGGDEPAAPLKAVGGPVDVEGGWFDAGDYLKFTHSAAYALAELLWASARGGPVRSDETGTS